MFRFRKNVFLCAALVLAAIAVGVAPSHAAKPGAGTGYTLVRLAPAGVAIASSVPYDVDDAGNVVGYYQRTSGQRSAFFFDRAGNTLQTLAGGTNATGLNGLGQIVGLNDTQAIYWSSCLAAPTALNGLTGQTVGAARAINGGGLIVGQSVVGGASHAVAWTVGTTSVAAELPPLPGETHSDVLGISEFDQAGFATVVGYCSTTDIHGDEDGRATMWGLSFVGGSLIVAGPIDLGSLKGGPSKADGVNLAGDACGKSDLWPFVKLDGQPMQALPGPGKAIYGAANDSNNAGNVVGSFTVSTRTYAQERAYLWSAGQAVDLNTKVQLGSSELLETGAAISNSGQIVGIGYFPTIAAGDVGFLLIPK